MNTQRENERVETEGAAPRRLLRRKKWVDRSFFLNSETVGMLILKIVILIAIPYAYVWLCGLLNEWLKLYSMVPFFFYSMVLLAVLAVATIVYAIIRFVKKSK